MLRRVGSDAGRSLNYFANQARKPLGFGSDVHAAKEATDETGLNDRERHPLVRAVISVAAADELLRWLLTEQNAPAEVLGYYRFDRLPSRPELITAYWNAISLLICGSSGGSA